MTVSNKNLDYLEKEVAKNPVLNVKPIVQGIFFSLLVILAMYSVYLSKCCLFVLAYSLDSIAKCAYGIDTNTYKGEDNIYFRVAEAFFADIRVSDGVTSMFMNLMYHFPYVAKLFGFFSAEAMKVVNITKQIIKDRDAKNIHLGDFVDR